MRSDYVPQLTGIRALAAYLVYVHHYSFPIQHDFAARFAREMHVGVNLFFVLSGFLIYSRYAARCEGSLAWARRYFVNRAARIYPLYLLLTVLTLLALHVSKPAIWVANLTLIKGFSGSLMFTGIPQAWSLTVEECFYFAAPLLFLWFRRRVFWIPMLAVYALGGVLLLAGHIASFGGFFDGVHFMICCTFFGRAFEFFAGMWVARRVVAGDRRPYATYAAIIGSLATMALLTRVEQGNHPAVDSSAIGVFANNIVIPVFFALLLYGLVSERSIVRRLLSTRLFVLLGQSSYAFYLVHLSVWRDLAFTRWPSTSYLTAFAVTNAVAIGLYLVVEEPLNRGIRKLAGSPEPGHEKGRRRRRPSLTAEASVTAS